MLYQKSLEIFKREYEFYKECGTFENKYEWAASHIFNLATYDSSLDELFVKKILEVCKVILNNKNYDYIEDEKNYITFISVCQLLNSLGWIDWGTSIRGAWIDSMDYTLDGCSPMLNCYFYEDTPTIYPCKESVRALVDFMEEVEQNGSLGH